MSYKIYGLDYGLIVGDSFNTSSYKNEIEGLFNGDNRKDPQGENIIKSDRCRLDCQGNYAVYNIGGVNYYNFSIQTNGQNSTSKAILYIDQKLYEHKSNSFKGNGFNLADQIKRYQKGEKIIAATQVLIDLVESLLIKSSEDAKKLYLKQV